MKQLHITSLVLFLTLMSCNPIKSKLSLTTKKFNLIKKDSILMSELKQSLEKDIDTKLINRRLDSFFLKSYSKHELITSIELDRIFKGKKVEIDRTVNKDSVPSFDTMDGMKAYLKKVSDDFHNRKPKDSL